MVGLNNEFFEFADKNPILTFFLAIIFTECIIRTTAALRNCIETHTSEDE